VRDVLDHLTDIHQRYIASASRSFREPFQLLFHRGQAPYTGSVYVEVSFRVERMKLSKDKSELRYNEFLTLRGIPTAAFDYRLGNRSALEWVIDQYRVSADPRSGIRNDPNREDDPQYILRLIGQVITVSLETQQIIAALPALNLGA
jgi:predicted helicase